MEVTQDSAATSFSCPQLWLQHGSTTLPTAVIRGTRTRRVRRRTAHARDTVVLPVLRVFWGLLPGKVELDPPDSHEANESHNRVAARG
mmetsp:Transcript_34931/g.52573  ORF Transcript_34931/g.52573 Transcript_34931/m.52573 type:complete len:88 (-) Transcript_34931:8-271(-)